MSYAAALAQTHFQYFADFGSHSSAPIGQSSESGAGDGARLGGLLRTPIDDLELSVRSVNSLKNSNIRTLGDLVRQTESQILQVKNFGKKSLQEIADLLEREGLEFRDAVRGEAATAAFACSIGARRRAAPPPPRPTTWRSKAMRHRKAGRQLRRTSEQKLALMRNLASSLIEHGAIETTEAKAKELRPFVEKLITKARSGTLHARRLAVRHIHKRETADKLFQEIGPKFAHAAGRLHAHSQDRPPQG